MQFVEKQQPRISGAPRTAVAAPSAHTPPTDASTSGSSPSAPLLALPLTVAALGAGLATVPGLLDTVAALPNRVPALPETVVALLETVVALLETVIALLETVAALTTGTGLAADLATVPALAALAACDEKRPSHISSV